MLGSAGKWFTALITTCAALGTLLVNAQNLGLTAWLGSVDLGITAHAARRITVTPRADTLLAIEDTSVLAATVTDRRGAVLVGALIDWRSEDTAVAVVDTSGVVVARGPGSTRITASVRDLSASARVIVRQRAERMALLGDSSVRLLEGDTLRIMAHALDARGHRVRGQPPRWQSGDTTVLVADSLGLVRARGPGRTVLRARVGEMETAVAIQVDLAPATLGILSGNGQRAPAGRPLAEPIVVLVLSRGGLPVSGVSVTLSADGGQIEPGTGITDRSGLLRANWTLGPRPGPQRLRARVLTLDSTATVLAEADPVPGNTRIELVSTLPTGQVGTALDDPIVVRVTDTAGAPLADVPVKWSALDHGRVTGTAERTDSLGQISAQWMLGPRSGSQRLRAEVGNPRTLAPFTVTATATSGPAAQLVVRSGQEQKGIAGRALPQPLTVVALDSAGNVVLDARVRARPAQGSVTDTAPAPDVQGRTVVSWTLGEKAGEQLLRLGVAGVDSIVTVRARAEAGRPAAIVLKETGGKAVSGTPLGIVATVTDAHGNPVAKAAVAFSVTGGRVTAPRGLTDDSGHAATSWTPGGKGLEQTLTARLGGTTLAASYVFTITPVSKAVPVAKTAAVSKTTPAAKATPVSRTAPHPAPQRQR
jgi:adhesin/invasin